MQLAKDETAAWTGGRPKSNWTALDPKASSTYTSPNQLRPAFASASQKGYNYRRTGLTNKYKLGDDLSIFVSAVWKHLRDTGMDTIAYLPDPEDPTTMNDVVNNHARYTLDSGRKLSQELLPKYDVYDLTNDRAAKDFLLDSLEPSLRQRVDEKLDDDDSLHVVWLTFIKAIQSTSIERFEELKAKIKRRLPAQYPGENLESLAYDFRKDAKKLTTAGQYDHNLTMTMLKIFLLAGGGNNEDFRHPLRDLKKRLSHALLEIGYKDKVAANKHMIDNKLTYKDICEEAETQYRTMYDMKEWPPAMNAKDSKTPPPGFGANALIQNAHPPNANPNRYGGGGQPGQNTGTKGKCHKCGKPGHFRRDCPQLKRGSDNSGPSAQTGGNSRSGPTTPDGKPPSWRTTAPAHGSPSTIKRNGKTFHWCAHCGRWSTTHGTLQHKNPMTKPDNNTPQPNAANYSLVPDPYAWNLELNISWWTLFFPPAVGMIVAWFLELV